MISRRGFLVALAGLMAAPSLVEKVKREPRMLRVKKVQGEIAMSRKVTTTSELDRLMKEVYSGPLMDDALADMRQWFVFEPSRGWIAPGDYIVFPNRT